jgi:hypothetical protein
MKNLYGFPEMCKIIPEGKEGKFSITHQVATEEDVHMKQALASIRGDWSWGGFEPGTYCVLNDGDGSSGTIIMSDTWFERVSNQEILSRARGDVLLAGLGIGLVPCGIIDKVSSLTAVEIEPDVIRLVEEPLRAHLNSSSDKLIVIQADIFKYAPTHRFDIIYFDIWQNISADNYEDIMSLHEKFRKYRKKGGWMHSWMQEDVIRLHY